MSEDHPLEGDGLEVDTGPPGVALTIAMSVPVLCVVRDTDNAARIMRNWKGPGMDYAPILARAIRNTFNADHGDVKVLSGYAVKPQDLAEHFAALGLAHDRTDDTTEDESAILAAKFIAKHFDPKLVHEALGKHIRGGVER